jgi:DNA-binding beta-propeller fold protein YncE
LPDAPVGIALSHDGERAFVTSQRGASGDEGVVSVLDVSALVAGPEQVPVRSIPAGSGPVRVAVAPTDGTVWVTARASNELLAFEEEALLAGGGPSARVRVGKSPVGVALSADCSLVLVADSIRFEGGDKPQTVSVVDASAALAGEKALLGTVPAGAFPREVTVLSDDETVLVTNFVSKTLGTFSIRDLVRDTGL